MAAGAPTVGSVQNVSSSTGAASISVTLPVLEGSLIVVQISMYGSMLTISSVTDSQGGSYTLLGSDNHGSVWEFVYVRTGNVVGNPVGTAVTVVPASGSTTAPIEVTAMELINASAEDAVGSFHTGTSTSPLATVTTSVDGDLVLFLGSAATFSGTVTYGSGQTGIVYPSSPPTSVSSFGSFQVDPSSGSVSSSATLPTSVGWVAVSVAFLAGTPWIAVQWKPVFTVSPVGLAAVGFYNAGADFGPDTPGTSTCGIQEAMNALAQGAGGTIILLPNNATEGYDIGNSPLTIPLDSSGTFMAVPIVIRAAAPLQLITYTGSGYALTSNATAWPGEAGARQTYLTLDGIAFSISAENGGGLYLNFIPLVDSFVSVSGIAGNGQTGINYLPNNNSTEEFNREFRVAECDIGLVLARDHVVLGKLVVAQAETQGLQIGDASNAVLDGFIGSFHLFNNAAAEYGIFSSNQNRSDVTIGNFVCEEDSDTPLVTYTFALNQYDYRPGITICHLYRLLSGSPGTLPATFYGGSGSGAMANLRYLRVLSALSELLGFQSAGQALPMRSGQQVMNAAVVCQRVFLPPSTGGTQYGVALVDVYGTAKLLPYDPPFVDLHPGESIYFNTSVPASWTWYGMASS
jgi:hypothetical protein